MSGLLVFGVDVEKTYGTAFYTALHFGLMVISHTLYMTFSIIMINFIPISLRGGPDNYFTCTIGYSNVLFGLAMIFSFIGDGNVNFLGICYLEKKYVPWYYMLLIYVTIPNSSFLGHFCGIIAALLKKFCGLYILFPKY